jgi:DNA-binding IclR family transcriptional regulator
MSTFENTADVLRLISRLQSDITVTDLIEHLGYPKSSASRTLAAMARHGLLERDPLTRAYRPGELVVAAAYHFRTRQSTQGLIEKALRELVDQTGCTGYVNVLDGGDSVVIHMSHGRSALQVYTPPGSRAPASASSIGRALLARMEDARVIALVRDSLRLAHGSAPRTQKDLLTRLADIRARGYSVSRGEFVTNVAGISAAVFDTAAQQSYGFGIALPAVDLEPKTLDGYARLVRDAAQRVGRQIGDPYWLAFGAEPR